MENPTFPPISADHSGLCISTSDITRDEHIKALGTQRPSNKDPRALIIKTNKEKKELLCKFIDHKNNVLERCLVFDQIYNVFLADTFKNFIPSTKNMIRNMKREDLSSSLADLYLPSSMLFNYLKEQQQHHQEATASLRRTSARTERAKDDVFLFLKEFMDMFTFINEEIVNDRIADSDIKLIKVTGEQKSRVFDEKRNPVSSIYQVCLICSHESINEPKENEDMATHNDKVQADYEKRLNVWNNHRAKSANHTMKPPTCPITKNIMKRCPQKPKHLIHTLQCMCSMSSCLMMNSDISSTCPIKCMNKATKER